MVRLFAFDAKKGEGSFVTFKLTSTPESPTEEFFLRVYLCDWVIRDSGRELAQGESSHSEIVSAVSTLNGRKLDTLVLHSYVTQEGLFHGASLIFDKGLTMKLQEYDDASPDDAIFITRATARTWISYLSDGSIKVATKA